MKRKSNFVFISWATHCSRSDTIARRLGGASFMVYSPLWGSRYSTIVLKYLSQTVKTLRILFRERPRVAFVMTPPVTACFAVWLYAKLTKASYGIDAHSGAFLDPRWRSTLFVHRFFSRHAVTTLVTSPYLEGLVRGWKAHATIVSDVPVQYPNPIRAALNGGWKCNMTLVSTFTKDEPLDLFLKAAEKLPDVRFFVTGSYKDADAEILRRRPDNVEFTGFLPDSKYAGLLMNSDAIICLTKEDHTMQRGAYEAIYLGKPVITSRFEILLKAFYKGAVHVDNTVDGIVKGILQMKENIEKYRIEAEELKLEKLAKWEKVENDLRHRLKENQKDLS